MASFGKGAEGQPSTMEEIRTITSQTELLEKTIFLRPANVTGVTAKRALRGAEIADN